MFLKWSHKAYTLKQESINFSEKGPDYKYFRPIGKFSVGYLCNKRENSCFPLLHPSDLSGKHIYAHGCLLRHFWKKCLPGGVGSGRQEGQLQWSVSSLPQGQPKAPTLGSSRRASPSQLEQLVRGTATYCVTIFQARAKNQWCWAVEAFMRTWATSPRGMEAMWGF